MRQLRAAIRRVRGLFHQDRLDGELDRELESHLQLHIEDNLRAGMSPEEARRKALLKLGGIEPVKERYRDRRGVPLLETLTQDVRYGLRTFGRSPGFTLVAILSLALGIGANTLVFSVLNALVLAPLPVEQPERLVFLQSRGGAISHSFPLYRDFRDRNETLSGVMGYRIAPMSLETVGHGQARGATRVWGYLATGNYFDLLGVRPALGRFFNQAEDRQPGASPFAVLSYRTWQARFSGDPAIVGRTIRINRRSYTVLGVAPPGFRGTELFYPAEVWVPMMMQPQIEGRESWLDARSTHNTLVAGRLKPGVTAAQAEGDLSAIAAAVAREHSRELMLGPEAGAGPELTLTRPGLFGDALRAPVRMFTTGVLMLAALVLLAGCANLASVLIARGADRQREMALRLAIGAGPRRLVRQLLTEALLLSLAGGLAGAALAAFLANVLSAYRMPMDLPVQFDVQPDATVFLFGLLATTVAGLLFGLAPARQAARTDVNASLKGLVPSPPVAGRRWALRDVLVTVQVAVCVLLVSACVLSLRGLQQMLTMPLGFEPGGLTIAGFQLGLAGYDRERGEAFQQRALDAVSALPGVQSGAYANSLPLSIDQSTTTVFREDEPGPPASPGHSVNYYHVSPGFFRTFGTQLLTGREIEPRDDQDAPRVAIVNETFVRRILRTSDPIGARFRHGSGTDLIEVVGVVEDGKYTSLTESPRAVVFWPMLQSYNESTTLVVRSEMPEEQMAAQVRRALNHLDPQLPLFGVGNVEQMLGFVLLPGRAAAISLTAFGLLALLLAATGIHGLLSYAVVRRRREIGIRMAVGASSVDLLRLVLGRTAIMVIAGTAIGLILALASAPLLAGMVYDASSHDPVVIGGAALIIFLLGVVSCLGPVRRSVRIDPVTALRAD